MPVIICVAIAWLGAISTECNILQ